MKTSINKFDYPTAASQTYKMYKQEPANIDQQGQKQRYKEFVADVDWTKCTTNWFKRI